MSYPFQNMCNHGFPQLLLSLNYALPWLLNSEVFYCCALYNLNSGFLERGVVVSALDCDCVESLSSSLANMVTFGLILLRKV